MASHRGLGSQIFKQPPPVMEPWSLLLQHKGRPGLRVTAIVNIRLVRAPPAHTPPSWLEVCFLVLQELASSGLSSDMEMPWFTD